MITHSGFLFIIYFSKSVNSNHIITGLSIYNKDINKYLLLLNLNKFR